MFTVVRPVFFIFLFFGAGKAFGTESEVIPHLFRYRDECSFADSISSKVARAERRPDGRCRIRWSVNGTSFAAGPFDAAEVREVIKGVPLFVAKDGEDWRFYRGGVIEEEFWQLLFVDIPSIPHWIGRRVSGEPREIFLEGTHWASSPILTEIGLHQNRPYYIVRHPRGRVLVWGDYRSLPYNSLFLGWPFGKRLVYYVYERGFVRAQFLQVVGGHVSPVAFSFVMASEKRGELTDASPEAP